MSPSELQTTIQSTPTDWSVWGAVENAWLVIGQFSDQHAVDCREICFAWKGKHHFRLQESRDRLH